MGATETDWQEQARELRHQGLSERQIAEAVGKAASSVHEAVKDIEVGVAADSRNGTPSPERLAQLAGDSSGAPTPGQLTTDGGEVQAPIEEIRVDGTTQLSMIPSLGGKKPQSATITLRGGAYELLDGKAFYNGDTVEFVGTAVVREVAQRHKPDPKTGIVVTCVQKHAATVSDLQVMADPAVAVRRLFDRVVGADRQAAAALADELVVQANGGG